MNLIHLTTFKIMYNHLLFGSYVHCQHSMTPTGAVVHIMASYCSILHTYIKHNIFQSFQLKS